MDSTIIAAIIAGSVAIASPLMTLYVTRWFDHRGFEEPGVRRKALVGKWMGAFTQMIESDVVTTPLEMTLNVGKKVIEGTVEFRSSMSDESRKFKVSGGFLEMPLPNWNIQVLTSFHCSLAQ